MGVGPLAGVRVLDRTSGIAGPYCTKLLADAGADVVKVEARDDPMRSWRSGALFEYLHAGKRSVADDAELVAVADVLVTADPADVGAARVVVTITPFGADGPWADRRATEFTLQAACGSIGQRGLPDRPPLAAGGRLGEWMTGTYAAVAAGRGAADGTPRARRRRDARLHGGLDVDLPVGVRRDGRVAAAAGDRSDGRGAVDRADRRRLGRGHDQQRDAVPGLPRDDRAIGLARRRRPVGRDEALRAARRVPGRGARAHDQADLGRAARGGGHVPHPGRAGARRSHGA